LLLSQETSNRAKVNFWDICLLAWQYSTALCTQTWGNNRKLLLKRVAWQNQQAFYTGKTNTETRMNTLKKWCDVIWQNKTLRAGLCFVRSWRGQLGLNLTNKRTVKPLNKVRGVELGGDGKEGVGWDCSVLIACWHRSFQQEGKGELQKQLVIEIKIKTEYC